MTILSRSASSFSKVSTLVPVSVMASVYSCAVTSSPGTKVETFEKLDADLDKIVIGQIAKHRAVIRMRIS